MSLCLSTTAYKGGSTGMIAPLRGVLASGSWRAHVVSCGCDWFIFKQSSLLWGLMACWPTRLPPSLSSRSLYHMRMGRAVCSSCAIWHDVLHLGGTARKDVPSLFWSLLQDFSGCVMDPQQQTLTCGTSVVIVLLLWYKHVVNANGGEAGLFLPHSLRVQASRWRNHRGSLKHVATLNPQSGRREHSILVSCSLSHLLTRYCSSHT